MCDWKIIQRAETYKLNLVFALHEKLHFSGMRRPVFLLIFEESCVNVNIVNYCKIVTLCKNILSPLIHITQLCKQLNDKLRNYKIHWSNFIPNWICFYIGLLIIWRKNCIMYISGENILQNFLYRKFFSQKKYLEEQKSLLPLEL